LTFKGTRFLGLGLAVLLFVFPVLYSRAQAPLLPKGTNISSLAVTKQRALENNVQQILLATLQGVVAGKSRQQI
jgi:hypothetical protein